MKKVVAIAVLYCSFAITPITAQSIQVDISGCRSVMKIFDQLQANFPRQQIETTIDSILQTKPYRVMFQHYNREWRSNHLPENVFKRMILSLKFPGEYKTGENQRADAMLVFWKKWFADIDGFKKNIRVLENANLEELIQKGVQHAQEWLPASMKIPDFYFFIHPNGGSPAFAINDNQGYDFFQLEKNPDGNINVQALIDVIAHESHHLGLKTAQPGFTNGKDSLAYTFLQVFVAEGTASKFADNMPGGFIEKISNERSRNFNGNIQSIWDNYTLHEEELFTAFENDLKKIYDGTYTKDSIQNRMLTYWLSGAKGRAYFLGAELFGAIYQAFGKQELFYIMEQPRFLLKNYNKSVLALDKKLKKKIVLSEWLMQIM